MITGARQRMPLFFALHSTATGSIEDEPCGEDERTSSDLRLNQTSFRNGRVATRGVVDTQQAHGGLARDESSPTPPDHKDDGKSAASGHASTISDADVSHKNVDEWSSYPYVYTYGHAAFSVAV